MCICVYAYGSVCECESVMCIHVSMWACVCVLCEYVVYVYLSGCVGAGESIGECVYMWVLCVCVCVWCMCECECMVSV